MDLTPIIQASKMIPGCVAEVSFKVYCQKGTEIEIKNDRGDNSVLYSDINFIVIDDKIVSASKLRDLIKAKVKDRTIYPNTDKPYQLKREPGTARITVNVPMKDIENIIK